MFDTIDEIQVRLRSGEDAFAEFKEVRLGQRSVASPNTEDFAAELVAFANSDGGVVFLGVDDDGVVKGIPDAAAVVVETWIQNIAANNCDPPIRPLVRKAKVPVGEGGEALVLLAEVRRSLYVHRTSGGRYLGRFGSTRRDLTSSELARLFQQRGRAYVFDEQVVPAASGADLDERRILGWLGGPADIPIADAMRNLRITAPDENGADRPTVAGLLAFGREPDAPHLLPSARIQAAVYHGPNLDSNDLVHADDLRGDVATQIEGAVEFVDRFMMRPARKGTGRQDFPQYPLGAVHEAVVNAVAHRDYAISGSRIRLFLFADRLELYSPGSLPNTLTLESMAYRVFTRNQLLVRFLSGMRSRKTGEAYLESRGEGVRRILRDGEEASGRRPEYRLLGGSELLLTVWARPSPHDEGATA
ncbi:MAG: putative DNA binding domain-containing protein [Deltaproteobacteria bacterium]|nr:putative DNA binding domain-containing protein [Deltaproteobacteria bacterium]